MFALFRGRAVTMRLLFGNGPVAKELRLHIDIRPSIIIVQDDKNKQKGTALIYSGFKAHVEGGACWVFKQ